jgi:hypothetical protein
MQAKVLDRVPAATLEWLLDPSNPAVAVLARRMLLREPDDAATKALWARRNEYAPVSAILEAMHPDGSWDVPSRDYQKYRGSLWQIHLLGELHADGADPRVAAGLAYAFSRQLADGSWSASNMRPAGSITCLTANVGRAVARLASPEDPHVIAAIRYCVDIFHQVGCIDCREGRAYQLNGYCHMLTPKLLLLLGEVPRSAWPDGTEALRNECVARLREREIFRSLPEEASEFTDVIWSLPSSQRDGVREKFLAEHPVLHYKDKPGWLRFGFPLSYNSDALESLAALAAVGEKRRAEYEPALALVQSSADPEMRWTLRNTLNGKMYGDVEAKGKPSRWLTLRALQVLDHFAR